MNKICLSAICVAALTAVSINAVDLGTVNVDSSTISDTTVNQKTQSSTVNVITEKEITKIDPKNINDLLQTIPGVTADVRSDVVEIHIRGIGQQEFMWEDTGVAVIIDGVPVLEDGGKVRGININDIASIKVIQGGASYLYGNTALAGAIIITTKKNKDKNGGSFNAEAGSYGYQDYKLKLYKSSDKFSANILAGYKYEDGYWWQTQNDTKTISGLLTYYLNDTSDLSFGANYMKKYQETTRGSVTGVTEAKTNPTGEDDSNWAYSHNYYSNIYKYYIKYNKDFNHGGNLLATVYYYKDLYNYESSPRDTNGDGDDDTYTSSRDKNIKQYGFKSEYRNSVGKLAYMLGLDTGQRKYDDYRETTVTYSTYSWWTHTNTTYYAGESQLDETKDNRYAVYGEAKYKVAPKFTMILNSRYDYDKLSDKSSNHDYDGTTWSDTSLANYADFSNMSYRVGATYDMKNNETLYANISTGFRNPTVSQYITNKNLSQETTINYEVGIRGKQIVKNNFLRYEASAFIMNTKDIIGKRSGTYYWEDGVFDNVGDARNQGVEVSLKSDRSKRVSFSIAYTYLDAYYTKLNPFIVALYDVDPADSTYNIVGNQLPRVPHHKIDFIVNFKVAPKVELMSELYAQSHYYADETNFVTMPGYAKVNLKATYRPRKNLSLYVKTNNIFNTHYYRTVYLFKDTNENGKLDAEDASITVDPGFEVYAGFTYKF